MKILIVGGVAGGASAAARLRRLSEDNEITIFERGDHISYANCGLPYYVGGVIEDEEDLLLQTPESFYARFHVQVRLRHEVISVLPDKKQVLVRDLQKRREYLESMTHCAFTRRKSHQSLWGECRYPAHCGGCAFPARLVRKRPDGKGSGDWRRVYRP